MSRLKKRNITVDPDDMHLLSPLLSEIAESKNKEVTESSAISDDIFINPEQKVAASKRKPGKFSDSFLNPKIGSSKFTDRKETHKRSEFDNVNIDELESFDDFNLFDEKPEVQRKQKSVAPPKPLKKASLSKHKKDKKTSLASKVVGTKSVIQRERVTENLDQNELSSYMSSAHKTNRIIVTLIIFLIVVVLLSIILYFIFSTRNNNLQTPLGGVLH